MPYMTATLLPHESGKPVEIQCLWLNALAIAAEWNAVPPTEFERAKASFTEQFWDENRGYLCDVVETGRVDDNLRPNQLLAIGGLPFMCIEDKHIQQSILAAVTEHLLTPVGLRTLDPSNKAYIGTYNGSQAKRDAAYHQGTAWPWLLGMYCDAYCTVHGTEHDAKAHIKALWEQCITASQHYGLHGICEVASGNSPHTPNGCPWQAWSVSEYIRIVKTYNV